MLYALFFAHIDVVVSWNSSSPFWVSFVYLRGYKRWENKLCIVLTVREYQITVFIFQIRCLKFRSKNEHYGQKNNLQRFGLKIGKQKTQNFMFKDKNMLNFVLKH